MNKNTVILLCFLYGVLCSCKHTFGPEPVSVRLETSKQYCAEGDTVVFKVFVNDVLYTGTTNWNTVDMVQSGNEFLYVTPRISADSTVHPITVNVQNQTTTQHLTIWKAAFRFQPVSYQQTVQPLLTNNCNFSGCHSNGSRAGNIELSNYDNVVKSVIPYRADISLLYTAMIKPDPLRVMPPAGPLHDYLIEEVRLWIEQGAHNN